MSHPRTIRCLAAMWLLWMAVLVVSAQVPNSDDPHRVFWMKTPLPLGTQQINLKPSGKHFLLLGCIEDQRFNQLQVSRVRESPFVIDAAGHVWKHYPDELTFRVTA